MGPITHKRQASKTSSRIYSHEFMDCASEFFPYIFLDNHIGHNDISENKLLKRSIYHKFTNISKTLHIIMYIEKGIHLLHSMQRPINLTLHNPTMTVCSHPSHPPPSPSPPNIPSPIGGQDDLDTCCLVTNREYSLAGRPFEE